MRLLWILLVALAGCTRGGFGVAGQPHDGGARCGPFTAPRHLAELGSSATEWAPAISSDELTIYVESDRSGTSRIWVATRAAVGAPFTAPALLEGIDGRASSPAISADDRELYFDQGTLYRSVRDRAEAPFAPSAALDIVGWPGGNGSGPWLSADGLSLYYGAGADVSVESHIALATRATLSAPFTVAGTLTELSPSSKNGWPTLSPDGRELLFESQVDGSGRIYAAYRQGPGDAFSAPEPLADISGDFELGDPELSRDGRTLYYASTATGDWEIWAASRSCP